jgi:hypothetical protein
MVFESLYFAKLAARANRDRVLALVRSTRNELGASLLALLDLRQQNYERAVERQFRSLDRLTSKRGF